MLEAPALAKREEVKMIIESTTTTDLVQPDVASLSAAGYEYIQGIRAFAALCPCSTQRLFRDALLLILRDRGSLPK